MLGAKQFRAAPNNTGLLRHCVPRNDEVGLLLRHCVPRNDDDGDPRCELVSFAAGFGSPHFIRLVG